MVLFTGLKSSTAKKRTFFAPDGAGTGLGVGGRGGGGGGRALPDVPLVCPVHGVMSQ